MLGLTKGELKVLKKLNTPHRIQDFLDTLEFNLEEDGETYMSPRKVLQTRKAHCLEGALLAATALWINGEEPLILDLKAPGDTDHVVTLYKKNGYWGAISKTNHAVLRHRDPIHKTIRELVASYFHEYFINQTGKKTLSSYTNPFNLKRLGEDWVTAAEDLWDIPWELDQLKHLDIYPKENKRYIRKADHMEIRAGRLEEWPKKA